MKMKRILLFFCFCAFAGAAQAQWTLRSYGEYEYTRTEGSNVALAVFGDYQLNDYFTAGVSLKGTLSYPLAMNLYWQADLLQAKSGTLYLENRYLYRLFPNYNLQEFNGLLDLGWRNRHFNFQLGLCNRYTAEIPLRQDGGMGTIFEPMNVTFCIEGNVFDDSHPWNIGGRISNFDDFIIERVSIFIYCITGYYELNDNLRLTGEVCFHPSSNLNLSAQPNGIETHFGISWTPKK